MKTDSITFLTSLMALVVCTGTLGYHFLEDWSLIDSFYMTITTLATVGFGEVHELDDRGKLFTIGLIICGVGIATYSFSKIVQLIVEGEIFRTRQRKKMENSIARLNNHIILCGYGRLGKIVLKDLLSNNQTIVVIEKSEEKVKDLELNSFLCVKGSAYDDEILKKAGIEKAKILLTLLPSDADNVYVTLCARDLNPKLRIVARTEDEGSEARLQRAGANEIISPYRISGTKIVQKVTRPYVSDFLEIAGTSHANSLIIEEVVIPPESKIVGKSIEDSDIRQKTGAIIAAIISPEGKMTFNPTGKDIIQGNSTMIILGEQNALDKFNSIF